MKTFISGISVLSLALIAAITVHAASEGGKKPKEAAATQLEKATFAGGCFWCMEHPFDELPGVVSVMAGYTGGQKKNPTYKEVSAGGTGHAESVQIVYDPSIIKYEKLLDVYWHNIDPTVKDRQFCDSGHQYRSAIFYHTEEQQRQALQSRAALEKSKPFKEPIVTEIVLGRRFLSGRGIPPALLQEESDPIPVLPIQVRARPAAQGTVGEVGRARNVAVRREVPKREPAAPGPASRFFCQWRE